MARIEEIKINRFDGGIVSDKRDPRPNVCQVVSNFDIFTNPYKLKPYYGTVSGDDSASTQQKEAFTVAKRTGAPNSGYSLFGFGIGDTIEYKDIDISNTNDLTDDGWATTANNSVTDGASTDFFIYYESQSLIYGRAADKLWSYSTAGSGFTAAAETLSGGTPSRSCPPIIHSVDDILYFGADNLLYKKDGASALATALTLPANVWITGLSEYGNYLAIATSPKSTVGTSYVYLWDRDSTLETVSEKIDWGTDKINWIEQLDGVLIGCSSQGGTYTDFNSKTVFKGYVGGSPVVLLDFPFGVANSVSKGRIKANNRIYFQMQASINGATREGVFSISKSKYGAGYIFCHELTPENDTAITLLKGFTVLGDYIFQAYTKSSTYYLSKTGDATDAHPTTYNATSVWESCINPNMDRGTLGDSSVTKRLQGVTVWHEPLPSGASVVVELKTDEDTSYGTTVLTSNTANDISKSSTVDSNGAVLPNFKELSFRIESTGGAVITGLSFRVSEIENKPY